MDAAVGRSPAVRPLITLNHCRELWLDRLAALTPRDAQPITCLDVELASLDFRRLCVRVRVCVRVRACLCACACVCGQRSRRAMQRMTQRLLRKLTTLGQYEESLVTSGTPA